MKRRYTHDHLISESAYVSIVNGLIVAVMPLAMFVVLALLGRFRITDDALASIVKMMQLIFIVTFLVNFLYYAVLVRVREAMSRMLFLGVTCGVGVLLFLNEQRELFSSQYSAAIVLSLCTLFALILIVNKTGWLNRSDHRYEEESWLYRHELADKGGVEIDPYDRPEDLYTHKYIDHHDENAPDDKPKPIDPEQDPKRAGRYIP